MNTPIEIPAEVQQIFDEGNVDSEFAATITENSVRLLTKDGKTVVKEVFWDRAAEFRRNLLSALMERQ